MADAQNMAEAIERERARLAKLRETAPYGPMCRRPDKCAGMGSCPMNPTCGD